MVNSTIGPKKVTSIERFIAFFHIPYIWGSLLLMIILGPLGAIMSTYICTLNFDEAIANTVVLFFGSPLPFWRNYIGLGMLSLIFFYVIYMIRYMRLKLVNTELHLISLLPEGADTYNKVFELVSRRAPPTLLGIIFMVLFSLQIAPKVPDNFLIFCKHPVNLVFLSVAYPFWFIVVTTFVWVYICSLRGLHELGKKPLKLKSFHEDKLLGVRPIGSLSLSFAFPYFTGLGILALLPSILLPDTPTLGYVLVMSLLILLGAVFFFLPLNTIHKKMLEAKKKEQELLRNEFSKFVQTTKDSRIDNSESMSELKDALSRLTTVLKVEVTKEEVETIPTWPIDIPILSRFVAMAISIIIIIVANIIMKKLLHL